MGRQSRDLPPGKATEEEDAPFLGTSKRPSTIVCSMAARNPTLLLLQVSIFLFVCALLVLVSALTQHATDRECFQRLNVNSPAIEALEIYEEDFANEFMQKSIYRGEPTPELEERWTNLWQVGGITVPESDLALLNKSEDAYVRVHDGFAGILEVHHQIHCLNLIRQFTWLDYYTVVPEELNRTHKMNREHVDHCIETLRLALMCRADVTPVLVLKDDSAPVGSRAEFNTHHKCIRWDKLENWMTGPGNWH